MLGIVRQPDKREEAYTKDAMTPPQFPKPICIAIPTPRFVLPPMLLPFHMTMIGIIGYLVNISICQPARVSGRSHSACSKEGSDILSSWDTGGDQQDVTDDGQAAE